MFKPNPGHLPFDCTIFDEEGQEAGFRRVHVILFNGWDSREHEHSWPSVGLRAPLTGWEISKPPHPFEIKEYCIV